MKSKMENTHNIFAKYTCALTLMFEKVALIIADERKSN